MKLQDKHKQFAVKSFAKMMSCAEVTTAFMQEFEHELPKPSIKKPEYPTTDIEQHEREKFIQDALAIEQLKHLAEYDSQGRAMFEQNLDKIHEQIEIDLQEHFKQLRDQTHNENLQAYNEQLEEHTQKLRADISNQLRVYNISHSRFPLKYRQIYDQTQREYLSKLLTDPNTNEDHITQELQTLYGFIKRRIIQGESTRDLPSDIKLAHTLLKTIATTKS